MMPRPDLYEKWRAAWQRLRNKGHENTQLGWFMDGHREAQLEVRDYLEAWHWLAEGRGPYAYDDPGYDEEVRRMLAGLYELIR